jgi:hypothetical protein
MQISEPDNGSYLLEALSDCANSELFQMIGGCIAGCICDKQPVNSFMIKERFAGNGLENMQKLKIRIPKVYISLTK